jgi:hypothetical protein
MFALLLLTCHLSLLFRSPGRNLRKSLSQIRNVCLVTFNLSPVTAFPFATASQCISCVILVSADSSTKRIPRFGVYPDFSGRSKKLCHFTHNLKTNGIIESRLCKKHPLFSSCLSGNIKIMLKNSFFLVLIYNILYSFIK